MNYPILDFDNKSEEIIKAKDVKKKIEGFPEIIVSIFSRKILNKWALKEDTEIVGFLSSANGKEAVYSTIYKSTKIGFTLAPIGSAFCVGVGEDLLAMGAKKLVYFGSCGVLDSAIKENEIIIPYRAIRDEGTSYHYQEPSMYNYMNEDVVTKVKEVLEELNYKYTMTTCWTTDAFYRETRDIVEKRKLQGAKVVDMETSALIAFSEFRKIKYAHFMYSADNLDATKWDKRNMSDQGLSYADYYMLLAFEIGLNI